MIGLLTKSEILPDCKKFFCMVLIIKGRFEIMLDRYYQTEEQLFGLYRFLVLLRNDNIYWHAIEPRGDRIIVRPEPPKGENEIRIFCIHKDGEVKDDDFREQLFRDD